MLRESSNFASSIVHAFKQSTNTPNTNHERLIKWNFPPAGTVKVNTDGSCLGNPGPASFGGVARATIEEIGLKVLQVSLERQPSSKLNYGHAVCEARQKKGFDVRYSGGGLHRFAKRG